MHNIVKGSPVKIHSKERVVSSIIDAIAESTPALVRYNFAENTNIGNIQYFEPEKKKDDKKQENDNPLKRQVLHNIKDEEHMCDGHNQHLKYNVKTVPIYEGAVQKSRE